MKTPPLLPIWLLLATFAAIGLAIYASIQPAHGADSVFDYQWRKIQPASLKPWLYVVVQDVDRTCREAGAKTAPGRRINGCAQWKLVNCIIYLMPHAPHWIIEHEEEHCDGKVHDEQGDGS